MPSLFSIGNGKSTGRTQSIDELKSLISLKIEYKNLFFQTFNQIL